MSELNQLDRWRKQRNRAAVLAVVVLVLSFAITLPRTLKERDKLKATNDELLQLQDSVRQTQDQIRQVEAQITRVEGEIRNLTRRTSS